MTARLCFDYTNNIAKYEAIELKVEHLYVYGDSTLVIHQVKEEWEIRDHKLIPYKAYIKGMIEHFEDIEFHHISREDNQLAEALANLSSMFEVSQEEELSMIKMQSYENPIYYHFIEEEVDGKPWYFDIKRNLKSREYPDSASENVKEC